MDPGVRTFVRAEIMHARTNPIACTCVAAGTPATMFGEVNFHLSWVYAFNNDLTCLFSNQTPVDAVDPNKKKAGILLDASGSMRNLQNEVKLMLSALKCMTGTIGMFNAPTPEKGTKIVDSVDELWGDDKLQGLDQLIVITDGYDTSSVAQRIVKCIIDGQPEYIDFPTMPATNKFQKWLSRHRDGEYATMVMPAEYNRLPPEEQSALVEEFRAWHKAGVDVRAGAVAAHLDALGIDMAIVGVGTEVKGFIAECAKAGRGLRTAHISAGADAEAVGAIMTTVSRRKPRTRTSNDSDETVVADTATAITEREATAVRSEALRTSTHAERLSNPDLLIDGPPFDMPKQTAYVRHVIESQVRAERPGVEDVAPLVAIVEDVLVFFFRKLLHDAESCPMASAILSGPSWPSGKKLHSGEPDGRRRCALFEVPAAFGDIKAGRWTHMLGKLVELLARNPAHIRDRVAKSLPFTAEIEAAIQSNEVGPLFRHAGKPSSHLAIAHAQLPHDDLRTRTMYFKFKADTFDHFILHHRDPRGFENSRIAPGYLFEHTRIMLQGNSSAKAYGGAECPPPEAPPPPAPRARARAPAAPAVEDVPDIVAGGGSNHDSNHDSDDDMYAEEEAPLAAEKKKRGRPRTKPVLAPGEQGEWGCSKCRWVDQGCNAKRCKPKPGAVRTESADASSASSSSSSSSSQEMEDGDEPPALDAGGQAAKSHKRKIADLETKNAALEREVRALKSEKATLCEEKKELKGKLARIAKSLAATALTAASDSED